MSDSQRQNSARSPFAGCTIFIAAVFMMVFLIGFSIYALFRQFGEIEKFTASTATPIKVSSPEGREASLNQLSERIESFRSALSGENPSSITLSADDLNLAIGSFEPLKELRGTLRVQSIEKDHMRLAISFPLNGKPRLARGTEPGWITSDSRFLNATLIARPALQKHEIILQIDAIEVPGTTVPKEFIDQMSPYRITERYLADSTIAPAMAKITRVALADGHLILSRTPGESPADHISDSQVDSAGSRLFLFLGIAATAFLLFAAIIIFLGLRAKGKKPA